MNHPTQTKYELLPFRFGRIPASPEERLLVSESGEFIFLSESNFQDFVQNQLEPTESVYGDLLAKGFAFEAERFNPIECLAAQVRSRKAFIQDGPGLHIIVVTLRCDHSCGYCQVSRQNADKYEFDISDDAIKHAVDRIFESRSKSLTVEFQGGEPLLAFSKIKLAVKLINERKTTDARHVQFVIASTLHHLNDEILDFCKENSVSLSTSLDGPEWLHNLNRPNRNKDSFRRTIAAIDIARNKLGDDSVSALTTITKQSLSYPKEIIDTYVQNGFQSISLRPLSPYGFAKKRESKLDYSVNDFLDFYKKALNYLIELNIKGIRLDESYAVLLLRQILTPFASHYVDLRSPTGQGLGVLVYNYDGWVYPSDEARMLKEMGDDSFRLGRVDEPLSKLMVSDAMHLLMAGGVAEALPGCSDCVYLPYCGADPMFAITTQGDPVGHRPSSKFCSKQTGQFEMIFEKLYSKNPETMRVFLAWIGQKNTQQVFHVGGLL